MKTKSMASVKLKLNKNRLLRNGTYPLVVQVIHRRRKKWIYTPYRLTEDEFDEANQSVRYVKTKNKKSFVGEITAEVTLMKNRVLEIISELSASGDYAVNDIVARYHLLSRRAEKSCTLLGYMRQRIDEKLKMKKKGIAAAYKSTMRSLEKFVNDPSAWQKVNPDPARLNANGSCFALKEVDTRFVNRYVVYLASCGIKENTISYYLRNFRAMYNHAVEEGYVPEGTYPFRKVKIREEETAKRALSREDLAKIAHADLEAYGEDVKQARDVFMFSYYCFGMSFIDIVSLKKENIVNDKIDFLCYSRTKTHQLLRVPILEHIKKYLDKYSSRDSDYIFSFAVPESEDKFYEHYRSELGRTNHALKKLGKILGIKTTLTTYVARHSFATLARNAGNTYSLIGSGLGHTTEETTRIYMKNFELNSLEELSSSVANL